MVHDTSVVQLLSVMVTSSGYLVGENHSPKIHEWENERTLPTVVAYSRQCIEEGYCDACTLRPGSRVHLSTKDPACGSIPECPLWSRHSPSPTAAGPTQRTSLQHTMLSENWLAISLWQCLQFVSACVCVHGNPRISLLRDWPIFTPTFLFKCLMHNAN